MNESNLYYNIQEIKDDLKQIEKAQQENENKEVNAQEHLKIMTELFKRVLGTLELVNEEIETIKKQQKKINKKLKDNE